MSHSMRLGDLILKARIHVDSTDPAYPYPSALSQRVASFGLRTLCQTSCICPGSHSLWSRGSNPSPSAVHQANVVILQLDKRRDANHRLLSLMSSCSTKTKTPFLLTNPAYLFWRCSL
jgi:hypothetical protein